MKEELELRMYFLVPYNISDIQKGIQAGHAAVEYIYKYKNDEQCVNFVENWKTFIILNGGTTGSSRDFNGIPFGTMDQFSDLLKYINYKFTYFNEPDLNNALSSLCFICDERVFNHEKYPLFHDWVMLNGGHRVQNDLLDSSLWKEKYIDFIGGEQNYILKEKLSTYKLA